jgi:translation initiation factor IF-2
MDEDDPIDLKPRPPVVTIMGHVDHGKTSLLDAIRNTRVTAGEAGGITQAISAYQAEHNGSTITFIDTPGHAAFTDMRERGANTADMIILVVAADDSVKQQTVDSIVCARQAGVPLLVAVNKIDLPAADTTRVLADLAGYEVLTEDLGGEVLCSKISGKQTSV